MISVLTFRSTLVDRHRSRWSIDRDLRTSSCTNGSRNSNLVDRLSSAVSQPSCHDDDDDDDDDDNGPVQPE